VSQGKKNIYTCGECAGVIVTVDRDEGVTPFMLGCRATEGCGKMMQSSFYMVNQDLEPTHEWFRPEDLEAYLVEEVDERDRVAMRDHIEQGGLVLRKIETSA
jgi:hypothetical protein